MVFDQGYLARYIGDVEIIEKEALWLKRSIERIFSNKQVDKNFVLRLESDIEMADAVEAFASRYGRFQDMLGNKLIPHLFMLEGEKPGSILDNLNRLEKRGVIQFADNWVAMREMRNKLVHEYIEDPKDFVEALNLASEYALLLLNIKEQILDYSKDKLQLFTDN